VSDARGEGDAAAKRTGLREDGSLQWEGGAVQLKQQQLHWGGGAAPLKQLLQGAIRVQSPGRKVRAGRPSGMPSAGRWLSDWAHGI
jgi:hypothetical protein